MTDQKSSSRAELGLLWSFSPKIKVIKRYATAIIALQFPIVMADPDKSDIG